MSRVDLSVTSTDFYKTRLRARVNGAPVDPTSQSVEFAFLTSRQGNPTSGDWHTGSWDTDGGQFFGQIEVGPLALVLPVNLYRVWVRINGRPVLTPGSLCIF